MSVFVLESSLSGDPDTYALCLERGRDEEDLQEPEGDWVARIRAKLLDRGLDREWVHRFCDQVGRWSMYLFPLSHALGRARLISATISRTNEDTQQ